MEEIGENLNIITLQELFPPTAANDNNNENHMDNNAARTFSDTKRHSMTWSLVNSSGAIPPARSGAASVVVGDKLYMFGK